MDLFDDEDDAAAVEAAPETFGHNKGYAERFERRKKKQEMARLQAELGDDLEDSEEAESEDEDAEMLTPELDLQILQTIDKIRNKDRKLYEPERKWFADDDGEAAAGGGGEAGGSNGVARKSKKGDGKDKVTLRTQLLEQGATAFASDDEDDDGSEAAGRGRQSTRLAYDPEQEALRRALAEGSAVEADAEGDEDEDEDGGGGGGGGAGGGLLRKKASAPSAAEELEYKEWLQRRLAPPAKVGAGAVDESVTLRRYMFGDGSQLDENERFLRDYVLNARWKRKGGDGGGDDDEEEGGGGSGGWAQGGGEGDGEEGGGEAEAEDEFSDRADDYERSHNFRYEEAGAAQVQGHARHDATSMRRQTKLARQGEKNEDKKQRKAEARRQKEAELRRLKNLKKAEILERLQTIQKVSGAAASLSEVDLSGDFDPEAFDRRMAEVYNDDYYAQEDKGFRGGADDADLPAELLQTDAAGGSADGAGAARGGGGFEALTKELQQSKDKKVRRSAQQYMDEYYALDFEDLIGGDLPTRFKYRSVDASGFGVTDEELLKMSDKELNQRVPIRYVKSPYGSHDEQRLKKRQKRMHWEQEKERRTKAHGEALGREAARARKAKEKTSVAGKEGKPAAEASEAGEATAPPANGGPADAAAPPRKRPKARKPTVPAGGGAARPAAGGGGGGAGGGGAVDISKKARKAGVSEERAKAFAQLKQKGGVRKKPKLAKQ